MPQTMFKWYPLNGLRHLDYDVPVLSTSNDSLYGRTDQTKCVATVLRHQLTHAVGFDYDHSFYEYIDIAMTVINEIRVAHGGKAVWWPAGTKPKEVLKILEREINSAAERVALGKSNIASAIC